MLAPLPRGRPITQLFICNKVNKRLWIQDVVSGELLYTPPDFIKLHNRDSMEELALRASMRRRLDIMEIMVFEARSPRGHGYAKRSTTDGTKWFFLP